MTVPPRNRSPLPDRGVSMLVSSASLAAPGRIENEDHAFRFGPLVGVLDGATVPDGFDTGCVHGPAWYVRRLAARIAVAAADRPTAALPGNLAAAILAVRADHDGRCDLDHPGTPSATVCLLRHDGDRIEYLVLCDSPLVVDCGDRIRVISDDRLEQAIAEQRETAANVTSAGGRVDPVTSFRRAVSLQRQWMNRTHGYWVAAADPDAAYHAVTGSLPLRGADRVRRAALLTDGASRAVEPFALCDWRGLLDLLTAAGPAELIRRVRRAEYGDGGAAQYGDGGAEGDGDGGAAGAAPASGARFVPRFKQHDDATATFCVFSADDPAEPGAGRSAPATETGNPSVSGGPDGIAGEDFRH